MYASWKSGIGDTGIRAGVIGEIATGSPLYEVPRDVWDLRDHEDMVPNEEKVLRAAGRAHIETGAPVSVHIYNYRPNRLAHHALDILSSEGADLERVAICHLDTRPDPDYVASVADRGAFVEFDTFGMEQYNDMNLSQFPSGYGSNQAGRRHHRSRIRGPHTSIARRMLEDADGGIRWLGLRSPVEAHRAAVAGGGRKRR